MIKKIWLWVSISSLGVIALVAALIVALLPKPLPLMQEPALAEGTYRDVTATRSGNVLDSYYGEIAVGDSVYYFGNNIENSNNGAIVIQIDAEGNEVESIDFDLPYRDANFFSFFSYVFSMQYWAEKEGFIAYLDYHLYYEGENGIESYPSLLTEGLENIETYNRWATALVFIPLDLSDATLLYRQAYLALENPGYFLNDFIIDDDRDDVLLNFTYFSGQEDYPIALENPFSEFGVENTVLQRYQFKGTDQPLERVDQQRLEFGTSWGHYITTQFNTYNFENTTSVGRYALMTLELENQQTTKEEIAAQFELLDFYGLSDRIKSKIVTPLEAELNTIAEDAEYPKLGAHVNLLLDLETLTFTDAIVHNRPNLAWEFDSNASLISHPGQSVYLAESYDTTRYDEALEFYGAEAQSLALYRVSGFGTFELVKTFDAEDAFIITSGFLNANGTITLYGARYNLISTFVENHGVSDAFVMTFNPATGETLQTLSLGSSGYDWMQYASFQTTEETITFFVIAEDKDGDFDFVESDLPIGPYFAELTFPTLA